MGLGRELFRCVSHTHIFSHLSNQGLGTYLTQLFDCLTTLYAAKSTTENFFP